MSFDPQELIIKIPVLLFAITIHEYSHGKAALSLGDPTAKNAGRLTLNPIKHIDPIGAIFFYFYNIGWAKPVPVDINYFENKRRDIILMSLSGPVSNIAAAFVAGIFVRNFLLPYEIYLKLLLYMLIMNTGLGLFNLLPIPPFDGSHVLEDILPPSISNKFSRLRKFTPFILLGIFIIDNYSKYNIFGKLFAWPIFKIAYLFGGDNFLKLISLL
jgi:Zn-dependent protease